MKSFQRMHGGELFVPKIPSARIVDLASALAPELPHRLVGIRPGEKLHEMMISRDDSNHTFEFARHFVIAPSIVFTEQSDYSLDGLGERGVLVSESFEYVSDTNTHYLSIDELRQLGQVWS
jgi:UDP-N-acetylglucosamine 4,6-dehydratase